MNRDDIIRMAREAGATPYTNRHYPERPTHTFNVEQLERFAALVAAHVRETEFKPDWNNYRQGLADGAAAEREACAYRAGIALLGSDRGLANRVDQAIRASGQV